MAIEVLVTNTPPEMENGVSKSELELFQKYMRAKNGPEKFVPFKHQAEAFNTISAGKEVLLVAGTAAGKTLAVAIPVFTNILKNKTKKAIFLYPTIALMEDQQKVLFEIAKITGLEDEIGYIQGGMTRGRLIENLAKKIIVATPDAIYWFFRKNVKYSSLLIYGLSCTDEFILDEAHVFSGLTIQNLRLFFDRIRILRKRFMGKDFKLHILTATPRKEISSLNNGKVIEGRSKCEDVKTVFYNVSRFDKSCKYRKLIYDATEQDYKKILVISNSASNAHRLFLDIADFRARKAFSPKDYMRFGRIEKSVLERYLRENNVSENTIQKLYSKVDEDDVKYRLREFEKVEIITETQHIYDTLKKCIYICKGKMKQTLYILFKENGFGRRFSLKKFLRDLRRKNAALEKLLSHLMGGRDKSKKYDYIELRDLIDESFEVFLDKLEDKVDAIEPKIEYPDLRVVDKVLKRLDRSVIEYIKNRFLQEFRFKKSQIAEYEGKFPRKTSKYLYFKWMKGYFEDEYEEISEIVTNLLESNENFRMKVQTNHVSVLKGTDYPIIVYSGSMSKSAREGLVDLFDELDKAVLISTSAVEVGVDFDADLLITEQCEAGAFMQRFGRVGRTSLSDTAAWVIVEGGAYGQLRDKIKGAFITREEFTDVINDTFESRTSIQNSILPEANFAIINKQIGKIGDVINKVSNIPSKALELAKELEENEIELNYGLRSTLPSISLLDQGVTKDIFHILQYVPSDKLEVTFDGFELAKADMSFTQLLYTKRNWDVSVNADETVRNCKKVFIYDDENKKINIRKGNAAFFESYFKALQNNEGQSTYKIPVLIYGDIYLTCENEYSKQDVIEDAYDVPIKIPKQFCLIFPVVPDKKPLKNMGIADIEEIYYDVDFEGKSKNGKRLILLDKVQGACISLFEKIMNPEGR